MDWKHIRIIITVVIISQALVFALHSIELQGIFILLGFRMYIPFAVAGLTYVIWQKDLGNFNWLAFNWKRAAVIFLFMVFCGIAIYFIPNSLWTTKEPENIFELGLSSIFDLPLYIIWNLPQFILLFLLIGKIKSFSGFLISFFTILLLIAVDFYFSIAEVKTLPVWVYAVAAYVLLLSILSVKVDNPLEFGIIAYLSLYLPFLLFGTGSELLVKMVFAKNFTVWDGFIKSKTIPAGLLLTGMFVIQIIPLLFIRRKK